MSQHLPINPDQIQQSDILLVHDRQGMMGWLIRKFTRSYWNHAALFVSKDGLWPKWVIEAQPGGVIGSPFELKYTKTIRDDNGQIIETKPAPQFHIAIARAKNLTAQQRKDIATSTYKFALQDTGYDYLLLILGMILHLLTWRRWHPSWLNRKGRFICSELVAAAYTATAAIEFGRHTSSGYVTPGDIAASCAAGGYFEIVMQN